MPDWYDTIADEWKTLTIATLTEIDATQFYTVVQALQQNVLSEAVKALRGDGDRVSPPYVIVQIGTESVDREYGVGGHYYRVPAAWHYVTNESLESALDEPAYCRSRLDVLRTALIAPGNLTKCQWFGADGSIDSSEDVAFAEQNLQLFAARLSFDEGFLTRLT